MWKTVSVLSSFALAVSGCPATSSPSGASTTITHKGVARRIQTSRDSLGCEPADNGLLAPLGHGKRKDQTFLLCNSVEGAVMTVLREQRPTIVAFGERHPNGDDGTKSTTLKLFAERILPVLSNYRYRHLVSEFFFSDDQADAAIATYLQTKTSREQLARFFCPPGNVNQHGIWRLLNAARRLGATVYGGGPRISDKEVPYIFDSLLGLDVDDKLEALMVRITRRTIGKVETLLRAGAPNVVTYNGAQHNDVVNVSNVQEVSFGEHFVKKTKHSYAEVDILSPEMMDKGRYEDYIYPEYERWLKVAVPRHRVVLIRRNEQSYTVLLPAAVLLP